MINNKNIIVKGTITLDSQYNSNATLNYLCSSLNDFLLTKDIMGGVNSLHDCSNIKYKFKCNLLPINNTDIDTKTIYSYFQEFIYQTKLPINISLIINERNNSELIPITKKPKYLYHYTSIDTLELILSNKNIRFANLENVDDINENLTNDLGELGKICFVSCWTPDDKESIPLWNMYSSDMRGVRIKLPANPFKKYLVDSSKLIDTSSEIFESNIDLNSQLYNSKFTISPPYNINIEPIIYTDEPNKILPKILWENRDKKGINFTLLGKYKETIWEFQSEWRYRIFILPLTLNELRDPELGSFENILKSIKKRNLPFKDYFLEIDDIKFKDMEITAGPKCNQKDIDRIYSLVEKFNPSAKVKKSKVSIR
ncbi:DUF2971 domain-containing protein [Clostridium perfringens]|nr:DUF2971 domain-containing protein [Clostridium perfringens]MDU3844271.1 DUF2971 domain-containing protein [Clostridium perfringens]